MKENMTYTEEAPSIPAQDREFGTGANRPDAGNSPDTGRGGSTGTPPSASPRLYFPDGSSRSEGQSPYAGLRAVAVSAALGLTQTHAPDELNRVLITVTEIKAARKDAPRVRQHVVKKLVASDDKQFFKVSRALCANRAEIRLAQRGRILRNVGTRTRADRDLRKQVGTQVQEIRSR